MVELFPFCAVCPRAPASLPLKAHTSHPGVQVVAVGAGGGGLLQQDNAPVLSVRRGRGWHRAIMAPPAERAAATEREH